MVDLRFALTELAPSRRSAAPYFSTVNYKPNGTSAFRRNRSGLRLWSLGKTGEVTRRWIAPVCRFQEAGQGQDG